ncbi:glycosyltransferase family 8 protein [Helicobacter cynogastricus]|uniref:glycosyltransferase family 8 protein n=1 Tax=Helicobacter cynogastricus TaxID=329937 RepID=UPI000CF1BBE1|nr:glycosyltransferase [Helicobacter cynogastricus]
MIEIPVVMAFDKNYCMPAGVAMHSMLTHAGRAHNGTTLHYHIHLLVQGLDSTDKDRLRQTIAPFQTFTTLEFHELPQNRTEQNRTEQNRTEQNRTEQNRTEQNSAYHEKLNLLSKSLNRHTRKRFSTLILCRLVLSSLFPQYDKILMCDVDVLFVGDIAPAYFMLEDQNSYYFAAAKEVNWYKNAKDLQRTREMDALIVDSDQGVLNPQEWQIIHDNYFNVGFMVIDLRTWRRDRIEEKCIELFMEKGHGLLCPEQDTLILTCYQRVLQLPYAYNVHLSDFNNPKGLIHQHVKNAQEVIMWHFYGPDKPWLPENLAGAQVWLYTLLQTPFRFDYFDRYYRYLKVGSDTNEDSYPLESLITKRFLMGYIAHKLKKKSKKIFKYCLWRCKQVFAKKKQNHLAN